MSADRRRDLLALARQYRLLIVEDDSCGLLSYNGPTPPALKATDTDELVIYLSSTSKILMPGLRLGWVVAPHPLHRDLIAQRRAADFCGPPFVQRALASFIQDGALKRHLKRVIPVYRDRRDTLLCALKSQMPPQVSWTQPDGGFACWLTLPEGVDATQIHREALRQGFAFTPGDAFLTKPADGHFLRICFASQPSNIIEEAITVLSSIIVEALQRPAKIEPFPYPPD
jgi:DNA-binding transcriptional MocR family regulator